MARPTKEGLDYFPLDIDVDQDDKLVVPIAKFGMRGFGVIVKLMMEVYRNGYYYAWTEKEVFVFSKRINDDINFVMEVINECIKWGFFSQELFDDYQILTSSGFQKRYVEASRRRKSVTFIDCYTLIDLSVACEKVLHPIIEVDADGNQVNVYINHSSCTKSETESTQSKVNRNRKGNRKEKEIKPIVDSDECNLAFEQFWNLYPSKTGKKPALTKWVSMWKKKPIDIQAVLDGTKRYIQYVEHRRKTGFQLQFKNGSTFVSQECWNDDYQITEVAHGTTGESAENPNAGIDFGF